MNETRDLLERVGDRFAFPDRAFERLERRRDRKRRNRRIAAGAAGIAVFAALVFALARATWSDSAPRPGEPPPSPTPSIGIEQSGNPILHANEFVASFTGATWWPSATRPCAWHECLEGQAAP